MCHPPTQRLMKLGLLYQAWRNSQAKPLQTALSLALLAFGVGMVSLMLLTERQVNEAFERNIKDIDLVLGAKGSPLQLILANVYHIDAPTGNINQREAEKVLKHPYIASGIPLAYGDNHEGYRIVGTEHSYVEHYGAALETGNLWEAPFEVTAGARVAQNLGLKVGDTFFSAHGLKDQTDIHTNKTFTVVGIFNTGSEIDDKVIFTSGRDGAKMLKLKNGDISGIRLYLDDAFSAPKLTEQLQQQYPKRHIVDWRQNYGKLFAAVKMEKTMMWIMLTLIIAVAAFNIVSALVMMVTEKQSEVAILKTQGLTDTQGQQIFMVQGLYNGVLGSLIGAVLGMLICQFVNDILNVLGINIIAPGYGGLPILMHVEEVFVIAAGAVLLSFIATLYPAYKAATINPVEVLRYE